MARSMWSRFIASALALTLLAGVMPAFADEGGTPVVAFHVIVSGAATPCDLFGMTATEAHEAVEAACATPTLAPMAVSASGKVFSLAATAVVGLDVDAMVDAAFAAVADTEVAPIWVADRTAVSVFVSTIRAAVNRKAASAKRRIAKHRLKVVAEVVGRTLDTTRSITAVIDALSAEIAAGGSAQATVTAPVILKRPKVTRANIGKTILVVLHERKVYLYKNTKLEKSYRCAIGMRAYPTPKGVFKVIAKNPHPSWHNPGSAWARGMPSVIGPGYYNPLGLRALYINSPGIRIHGTAKTWSMGRAASHGCIRLTNKNVVDIYPRVKVGTPVYILS